MGYTVKSTCRRSRQPGVGGTLLYVFPFFLATSFADTRLTLYPLLTASLLNLRITNMAPLIDAPLSGADAEALYKKDKSA